MKEVLILNRDGNVADKIDQNSDIQDIIPYEGKTVIFKVTKALENNLYERYVIFYDLNRKKILRHIRDVGQNSSAPAKIQLFRAKGSEILLEEYQDGSRNLIDIDYEDVLKTFPKQES